MNLLSHNTELVEIFWARPVTAITLTAILAGVVVFSFISYRHRAGLPNWLRVVLMLTRVTIGCLIVCALLEPTAKINQTLTHKKRVPVLIDVSESMSIKDQRKRPEDIVDAAAAMGMINMTIDLDPKIASRQLGTQQRNDIANATRLDLAKSLLSHTNHSTLASLSNDVDLSYYSFGKELHQISDSHNDLTDALKSLNPIEKQTSIAAALAGVGNADRGNPLSGIILFSDGIDTSQRQIEQAAAELGRQGIPVYTVPIGISSPDDVSIRSIVMQEVAFSGDKVPVRVQLESRGYEKRSVEISIHLNDRNAASRTVTLNGGLQFEDVFFNVDILEKGAAKVKVKVSAFDDEATELNNVMERSVRVVNEKINVLCMEGSARWEYRYLRAMLKRDPRINATFIATRSQPGIARQSTEYIARFPSLREDAFKYDLVILGDVNSNFFSPEELALLEELIKDRGASLLMLAGARYAPSSYKDTAIEDMLPVRFDAEEPWSNIDDNVYPVLTPEGRSSLVLTLEDEQELNDRTWSRVAPLDRIPPILSSKPGATVLAELSDANSRSERYPLISWQRYGSGKCMFVGTDRLWLLRFKTGDKYHWRAWSQCIQFLTLSRLMGEHKRIRLETDRANYTSYEQVQLYAHVLDDNYDPIEQAGFDVNIINVDNDTEEPQRVTLRPDISTPGLYEGYFSPPTAGRYRVEANDEDIDLASTTEFQIADINLEMVNTRMQVERLQRISDISGGELLHIRDFQKLSSLVDRSEHSSTLTSDHPLWDNGVVACLIILLMGTEWIIRRRYDLS